MPSVLSTVSRRARRDGRGRVDRVQLNDLFELFPELPRFHHRPLADQVRRVRENIRRMQRRAEASVIQHRATAAQVKASWLARRRG